MLSAVVYSVQSLELTTTRHKLPQCERHFYASSAGSAVGLWPFEALARQWVGPIGSNARSLEMCVLGHPRVGRIL